MLPSPFWEATAPMIPWIIQLYDYGMQSPKHLQRSKLPAQQFLQGNEGNGDGKRELEIYWNQWICNRGPSMMDVLSFFILS